MKTKYSLRSINRLSKYNEYFDRLAKTKEDGDSKSLKTFTTIKDAMIFCAFLGAELDSREPLDPSEEKTDIQEHIFTNDSNAMASVFLIGILGTKDWSVLHPDNIEQLATIFEEYANGGMEKLSEAMDSNIHDLEAVDTVIDLLRSNECMPAAKLLANSATRKKIEF